MNFNHRMLHYVENTLEMLRNNISLIDISKIPQHIDLVYEYIDASVDRRKLFCKLDIPLDDMLYDDMVFSLYPESIMHAFRNFIYDVNNNNGDFDIEELVAIYGFNKCNKLLRSPYLILCKIAAQNIMDNNDPLIVKAGVYIIALSGFNSKKFKKEFGNIAFDIYREYYILEGSMLRDSFSSVLKHRIIYYANDLTAHYNLKISDYFVDHPDRLMF